jgi:uncharacterized protein (TIGR00156 family)
MEGKMKRALVVAITLLTFVTTGSLWAGFKGPGGENLTTVAAAKKARDESHVTLTGNIVKQVKHEYYIFRDSTGEIEVEIDGDEWGGITVTPETTVKIVGEVDKHMFRSKKVDAKRIEIVSDKTTSSGGFKQN